MSFDITLLRGILVIRSTMNLKESFMWVNLLLGGLMHQPPLKEPFREPNLIDHFFPLNSKLYSLYLSGGKQNNFAPFTTGKGLWAPGS